MAELLVDEVMGGAYLESNFSKVVDARTGLYYEELGAYPGRTELVRLQHSLQRGLAPVGGGRVYRDSTDEDAEFSITELSYLYKGSVVTIAAAINVALSGGNVAHYVYATAGAFGVSAVGWPATPHVRIAVITLAAGTWDWSNVAEHRHHQALGVTGEPIAGLLDQEDFTGDDTLTAGESGKLVTNIGAGAEVILTLPTPAKGLIFEAIVMAAQYLQLKAAAGHTIQHSVTGATASGGFIRSNAVGAHAMLRGVSTTQWVQTVVDDGSWTIDV